MKVDVAVESARFAPDVTRPGKAIRLGSSCKDPDSEKEEGRKDQDSRSDLFNSSNSCGLLRGRLIDISHQRLCA